jgi:DNA-binding CsgD family transcriptional regulator
MSSQLLSDRELEVVGLAARGKTYQEIGTLLGIAADTAKTHMENAGQKLNTSNKTHTVAVAVALGLIQL